MKRFMEIRRKKQSRIKRTFLRPPSTGSPNRFSSIERDYRDKLCSISEKMPFVGPVLKRAKVIVHNEKDVEIVVQFKVMEDLLKVLDISSKYNLPEIKFREEFF